MTLEAHAKDVQEAAAIGLKGVFPLFDVVIRGAFALNGKLR